MTREETKKLWFHTIIFIVLFYLILLVCGFLSKERREMGTIDSITGLITMSLLFIIYSLYMLKWFCEIGLADKNKSLWSGLGESGWSLVYAWTQILVIGIIILILAVIGMFVGICGG